MMESIERMLLIMTGLVIAAWIADRLAFRRIAVRDLIWRTTLVLVALTPGVVAGRALIHDWQWQIPVLPAPAMVSVAAPVADVGTSRDVDSLPAVSQRMRQTHQPIIKDSTSTSAPDPLPRTVPPEPLMPPVRSAPAVVPAARPPWSWTMIAVLVWVTGSTLRLVALGFSVVKTRRVRRSGRVVTELHVLELLCQCAAKVGLRKLPVLSVTSEVVSPVTVGIVSPQIIIPPGLLNEDCRQDLRAVLLHECGHVRRHDLPFDVLLCGVVAALWFHPLIHLLASRVRQLREEMCDNHVLAEESSLNYAETLLRVAIGQRLNAMALLGIGIFSKSNRLEQRIASILSPQRLVETRATTGMRVILMGIAACLLVSGLWVRLTPAAANPPQVESGDEQIVTVPVAAPDPVAEQVLLNVDGVVTDIEGKPLPGTDVILGLETFVNRETRLDVVDAGTADQDGRYQLKIPQSAKPLILPSTQFVVWGLAQGHAAGIVQTGMVSTDQPRETAPLMPAVTAEVHLVDEDEKPVEGELNRLDFGVPIPLAFQKRMMVNHGDGRFELRHLPANSDTLEERQKIRHVWIQMKKLGLQEFVWRSDVTRVREGQEPVMLTVRPLARIKGQLQVDSKTRGDGLIADVPIRIQTFHGESSMRTPWCHGLAKTKTDSQGKFEVEVAAGQIITLTGEIPDSRGVRVLFQQNKLTAPAGELTEITVPVVGLRILRGNVQDQDGKGVPNVELAVSHGAVSDSTNPTTFNAAFRDTVFTDKDGRFSLPAVPGDISITKQTAPGSNIGTTLTWPATEPSAEEHSEPKLLRVPEGEAPFDVPAIKISLYRGIIQDQSAQPVKAGLVAINAQHQVGGLGTSQADGTFLIEVLGTVQSWTAERVVPEVTEMQFPGRPATIVSQSPLVLQLAASTEQNSAPTDGEKKAPLPVKEAAESDGQDKDEQGYSGEPVSNVSGRVIDPDGRPVRGATVLQGGWGLRKPRVAGATDAQGRFRVETKGSDPWLVAVSPGFGLGTPMPGKDMTIKLVPDIPVAGRVVDEAGKPLAGARIRVRNLYWPWHPDDPIGKLNHFENGRSQRPELAGNGLDAWLTAVRRAVNDSEYRMAQQHLLSLIDPAVLGDRPRVYAPLIPPVKSDADGRFTLKGIGADRVVELYVDGLPDHASRLIVVATRNLDQPIVVPSGSAEYKKLISNPSLDLTVYGKQFQTVLPVGRVFEGVVTERETGKPVVGVKIIGDVITSLEYPGCDRFFATTDEKGFYRIEGFPTGLEREFVVEPPPELPLFGRQLSAELEPGPGPQRADISLARCVWITGQVIDAATGQGVSGETIEYHVFRNNPHLQQDLKADYVPQFGPDHTAQYTDRNGKFRIRGYPGRGIVSAGGGHEYLQAIGVDAIQGLKRDEYMQSLFEGGGFSPYLRGTTIEVNVPDQVETFQCEVKLFKGKSRNVIVKWPDGKALGDLEASGLNNQIQNPMTKLETSRFQVTNLFPGESREVVARYVPGKLIGMAVVTEADKGPVSLKLVPWATVSGRLVDDNGQPRSQGVRIRLEDYKLPIHTLNGRNYDKEDFSIDAEGRFQLKGLVPHARYRLQLEGDFFFYGDLTDDFTLQPGEDRDLGDVKVLKKDKPKENNPQRQSS